MKRLLFIIELIAYWRVVRRWWWLKAPWWVWKASREFERAMAIIASRAHTGYRHKAGSTAIAESPSGIRSMLRRLAPCEGERI